MGVCVNVWDLFVKVNVCGKVKGLLFKSCLFVFRMCESYYLVFVCWCGVCLFVREMFLNCVSV